MLAMWCASSLHPESMKQRRSSTSVAGFRESAQTDHLLSSHFIPRRSIIACTRRVVGVAMPTYSPGSLVRCREREWVVLPFISTADYLAAELGRRLQKAAHRRVRQTIHAGRVTVRPQLPLDVVGVYVLVPVPKGIVGQAEP